MSNEKLQFQEENVASRGFRCAKSYIKLGKKMNNQEAAIAS